MGDKSGAVNGLTLTATYKNLGYTFDFGMDKSVVLTTSDNVAKNGSYLQSGQNVDVDVGGYVINCTYDGTNFAIVGVGKSDKSRDDSKDGKSEHLDLSEYSEFSYNGIARYYLFHKPRDLPENAPLIFMLHWSWG